MVTYFFNVGYHSRIANTVRSPCVIFMNEDLFNLFFSRPDRLPRLKKNKFRLLDRDEREDTDGLVLMFAGFRVPLHTYSHFDHRHLLLLNFCWDSLIVSNVYELPVSGFVEFLITDFAIYLLEEIY